MIRMRTKGVMESRIAGISVRNVRSRMIVIGVDSERTVRPGRFRTFCGARAKAAPEKASRGRQSKVPRRRIVRYMQRPTLILRGHFRPDPLPHGSRVEVRVFH